MKNFQKMDASPPRRFEVVISGFSGTFPACKNIEELKEKLFSKDILIENDLKRWNPGQRQKPLKAGLVPEGHTFDYTFMGMSSRLAYKGDPSAGPAMEKCVEAMFDAGVNPFSWKGRNVAVLAACSLNDAEMLRCVEGQFMDSQNLLGLARTMTANRISYIFNFTGPSYNLDSSWISSLQGLELAATLVAQGAVESAVVVTSNLTFHDSIETEYQGLNILSDSERCSPFDSEADGCVRSEAVVSFFLQRSEDAKRQYCTLLHTEARCLGSRDTSYIHLDNSLATFLRDFYHHCGVDPSQVSYIETFGSGIKCYDSVELNAISDVFCSQQPGSLPLVVGSISGNSGNTECPSGFVSLAKAVIALETGLIPPTINYHSPNPDVPALGDGRLKPVTENTYVPEGLVAVTSLGFSGTVAHVLLKQFNKTKQLLSNKGLPRLVIFQARHEEDVKSIDDKVSSMEMDIEFISMVNEVFKHSIPPYLWRGYRILPAKDINIRQNLQAVEPTKKPIWFIFSGMGSQWPGMARELMEIPVFASAIDKCDKVLSPLGVDIKYILATQDPAIFDNILNCFIGITAVQIGLVDILNSLGVSPDGLIGHSAGEIACGYADGCFTAEETILVSYFRGKVSQETALTKGMMASIGMGYNTIQDILPSTIDVACHNSAENCTVSGPAEDVHRFIEDIKKKGVFAKAVNVAGIAYHSRYIQSLGPKLIKELRKILPNPKPRSSRWVSSSALPSQWHTLESRLCSADYHTNNLLSPVLFEEACHHLPEKAILIEVGPHGILQSILKRSVSAECLNIALTNRTAQNGVHFLLSAIGQLHLNNVVVDVNSLYPPMEYPVSRGTPRLAPLVTWDHKDNTTQGFMNTLKMLLGRGILEKTFSMENSGSEYKLYKEHRIHDEIKLPLSQLLMYPWKMAFTMKHLAVEDKSVVFENIKIRDYISIDSNVLVTLSPVNMEFEISPNEGDDDEQTQISISGKITVSDIHPSKIPKEPSKTKKIIHDEMYHALKNKGYYLGNHFQSIKQIRVWETGCLAVVEWNDMVGFLEALFHIVIFFKADEKEGLSLPSTIQKITINTPTLKSLRKGAEVEVIYDHRCSRLICEGVEILGVGLARSYPTKQVTLHWMEKKLHPCLDNKPIGKVGIETTFELTDENWLGKLRDLVNNKKDQSNPSILVVSRMFTTRDVLAVLTLEPYYHQLRTLFIMDKKAPPFSLDCPLYKQQLSLGLSVNVLNKGVWHTISYVDVEVSPSNRFTNYFIKRSPQDLYLICIGLNTPLPNNPNLGVIDYSGLKGGERVMGVARLDQGLVLDQTLKWTVPAHWTMEEAATVPAIYSMAYYCSQVLGMVKTGQNVLVTDGHSLIGQAITSIVLQLGARVIVSLQRKEDKATFLRLFPNVNPSQVLVLEDGELVPQVKLILGKEDIDVIINSLNGKDLWFCNSLIDNCKSSRFVHHGLISPSEGDKIGLWAFNKGNAFFGTNISEIMNLNVEIKEITHKAVSDGIEQGVVKPLKRQQFLYSKFNENSSPQRNKNIEEKTLIVAEKHNNEMLIIPNTKLHQANLVLLVGPITEQYLDHALWLSKSGIKKLILLPTKGIAKCQSYKRLQKILNLKNVSTYICLSTYLKTLKNAISVLKDISHIGRVSSIVCLSMDENSNLMRNLELASREVLPTLPLFVSLFGNGTKVCESREMAALPVLSIKSESSDIGVNDIQPYLNSLMSSNLDERRFLTIKSDKCLKEKEVFQRYLPPTLDNLYSLGLEVSDKVQWVECRTLSPGYSHVHHNLLPVFVVSAVGSHTLQPLLANLMHPAFCASPPHHIESIEQHANDLMNELTKIQEKGPYNLLGDWWSGRLTLALGGLLEEHGHQVEIFLLEGAPSIAVERMRSMCESGCSDLESGLLAWALSLSDEKKQLIRHYQTWNEKIDKVLAKFPHRDMAAKGLTSLYSLLTCLQLIPSPTKLFHGGVTLMRTCRADPNDICDLSMFCKKTPKVVITEANTQESLANSLSAAQAINEHCAFDWDI